MKLGWSVPIVLAGGIAAATAQSPRAGEPAPTTRGLVRTLPQDARAAPDAWREKLRASDLAARERSFEQLVAAARRDTELRAELERWSQDGADLDLAWSARLALRELRTNPFELTPWGLDSLRAWAGTPFDPQSMLEESQRRQGTFFDGQPLAPSPDDASRFESLSLELSSDGVTCKVTRHQDGRDVTEQYTAPTMEELLDAHPELKGRIGVAQGGAFGAAPGLRFPALPWWTQPSDELPSGAPAETVLRTDILGVAVDPLAPGDAQALGLEPGVGLRIERVEPGTIARRLGLLRGQVVVEINGAPIRTRDDISAALAKRGADGELSVIVVDRWGQKRTRVWKPDAGKQL